MEDLITVLFGCMIVLTAKAIINCNMFCFYSGIQVRFIYETFKKMRPGMTVLCLHGAMKQLQRVAVYDSFCRKEHAILFATDIAARGLGMKEYLGVLVIEIYNSLAKNCGSFIIHWIVLVRLLSVFTSY